MVLSFPGLAPLELLLEGKSRQFRSLVILKQFKFVYYIKEEVIYIADIWDCRRDPKVLIKDIL